MEGNHDFSEEFIERSELLFDFGEMPVLGQTIGLLSFRSQYKSFSVAFLPAPLIPLMELATIPSFFTMFSSAEEWKEESRCSSGSTPEKQSRGKFPRKVRAIRATRRMPFPTIRGQGGVDRRIPRGFRGS